MKIALISTDLYIYSHGVRAISAYLKKHGHQTIILSMSLPQIKSEEGNTDLDYKKGYSSQVLNDMIKVVHNCDIIGVSSMASTSFRAIQIINKLKELKKPVVWGGIFPTTFPEYCIKRCDIICVGEGELALLELVNKLESKQSYHNIQNLWLKTSDGQIIKNSVRNYIDVNLIPIQDYNLDSNFILEKYKRITKLAEKHIGTWLYYHSMRGCAFSCTYCCNCELQKIYQGKGEKIRKRAVDLVISDLVALTEKFPKVKHIWFTDDDINLRTTEEIKDFAIKYKEKVNLPFRTYMTPTTVNEEKLKTLIDAGLIQIEMGVQTGSDRLNKEIYGRNILNKDVLKAANLINKFRNKMWPPSYQIIITNPYEKQQDVLDTINLLKQIPKPHYTHTFGLVFFPGTPLYHMAVRDGIIKRYEDSAYDIDYMDFYHHLRIKDKNLYLNSILCLINPYSNNWREGLIPNFLFKYFLKPHNINYFKEHKKLTLLFSQLAVELQRTRIIFDRFYKQFRVLIALPKAKFYTIIPAKIKEPIKKALNLS